MSYSSERPLGASSLRDGATRFIDANDELCTLIERKIVDAGLLNLSELHTTDIDAVRVDVSPNAPITVSVEIEATFGNVSELCDALDSSDDGQRRKPQNERRAEQQQAAALVAAMTERRAET